MCHTLSLQKNKREIENRFSATMEPAGAFEPFYYRSAFKHGNIHIIPQESPGKIIPASWGLVPEFALDNIKSFRRRYKEITARSEDILSSAIYSDSARRKRCLVIADGFFEAHYRNDTAYPFLCHFKNHSLFAFAGLYSEIAEGTFSCCILTTVANEFFSKLYNLRDRMPLVLNREMEAEWLGENLAGEGIAKFVESAFTTDRMEAYPVSGKLYEHGVKKNLPFAVQRTSHPEIENNGSYFD